MGAGSCGDSPCRSFFFFQAEDGIRDKLVTGVQTCALPILAVDLRRSAATFGRWVSLELAADNRLGLYIPPGFAHGFYTLSDLADVMYKLTQEYSPSHEGGIVWNDPDVGIVWPGTHPTISGRDAAFPRLRDADPAF